MRRWLYCGGVLSCLLGVTACGSATHLSAGPCRTAQLSLALIETQGATGHIEVTFELRNISTRACALYGYPGALMLDAQHKPLPTEVIRGAGFFPDTRLAPTRVRMASGIAARFGLSFSDNNEYRGQHRCLTASWVEITPPNARTPLQLALRGRDQPHFAPCGGRLFATPVYAA